MPPGLFWLLCRRLATLGNRGFNRGELFENVLFLWREGVAEAVRLQSLLTFLKRHPAKVAHRGMDHDSPVLWQLLELLVRFAYFFPLFLA